MLLPVGNRNEPPLDVTERDDSTDVRRISHKLNITRLYVKFWSESVAFTHR